MTENPPQTLPDQVDDVLESAVEPQPFLQITSTYPAGDEPHRIETICLELNMGGGAVADDGKGSPSNLRVWLNTFCTDVIAAMRRGPAPTAIMLSGPAVGSFLTDRVRHTDDCDGSSCGLDPAAAPPGDEPLAAPDGRV